MELFVTVFLLIIATVVAANDSPVWTWECENQRCEKKLLQEGQSAQGLAVCKQRCDTYANLWPRPTGELRVSQVLVPVNPYSVSVEHIGSSQLKTKVQDLILSSGQILQNQIQQSARIKHLKAENARGHSLFVHLAISDPSTYKFSSETDESYQIIVTETSDGRINATISSETFFGARHGEETLNQLIIFDEVSGQLLIPSEVYLNDRPVYPYRGILLDTSRSYFTVESIKRTLDGMAASKLNTFHWHITDSQSFPFESKTYPNFSRYGAYSSDKVYSYDDIKSIVEYGRVRGVRVLPELDQPAHVGEGWQWAPNTTVCFKAEPWTQYCVEPPCGQLDPTNPAVYDILFNLYKELFQLFDSDLFHMGGDEVNLNCWNSTQKITQWMIENGLGLTESDFIKLWKQFQDKSYARLIEANGGKQLPVILWTSHLTAKGQVHENLDKDKYIIQIWTKGNDEVVPELVRRGFRVIFSNYEALYLDCGFGAWVGSGNNWCSPYIGWQKVYDNDPLTILQNQGINVDDPQVQQLALGAEATLFAEQVDSSALDSRLWPRSAAMAERLWSRPKENWLKAELRFLEHRERLVRRGIGADQLEPEWCLQNQGYCYA